MNRLSFIFLVFIMPLAGISQQTIYGSITHDEIERDYILYVPASYSGTYNVPLVLNFHGYGSNATQQMYYGDFRSVSDTAGFLCVHPEGTLFNGTTHWNVGGWTVGSTVDDVGFAEALIDSLALIYSIDLTRVYATGMSNGGFMSFLLASQLSEKIAAIGSVTGSMTTETYNNSSPQHPMPILQFHGTSDPLVPYNGNSWSKTIEDVLAYWAGYNNCSLTPEIIVLPDIDPNDGSTVEHFIYDNGDNNVAVEHFKITGGGHTWPGNGFGGPGTNYDIDASVELWKFFSRYDIYGLISTTSSEVFGKENVPLAIYPNPATFYVNVEINLTEPANYEIHNMLGKKVQYGDLNSKTKRIEILALAPGLYFLKIGDNTIKFLKAE